MSETQKDTLHSIYEYSLLTSNGKYGEEYVVRGARVYCGNGSTTCVMNLPQSHKAETQDGRPLIVSTDHTKNNIKGFGTCRITNTRCTPKLEDWQVFGNNMEIKEDGQTLKTVTKNATTRCTLTIDGTKVITYVAFGSSGQVVANYEKKQDGAIEIVEDQRKSWKRDSDSSNDFLGYFKPNHSGIYNINVYTNSPSNGGTIFLYYKSKLIGSYDLEIAADLLTTNLVLDKNTNYYIEIDCPNLNSFEYLLCGNQEIDNLTNQWYKDAIKLDKNYYAAIWLLDSSFNIYHNDTFLKNQNENAKGVTSAIFYLESSYRDLLKDALQKNELMKKKSKQITSSFVSNALSGGSLALTMTKFNKTSIVLSAVSLFISLLPDSQVEKLIEKFIEYEGKNVILYFYDKSKTRMEDTIKSSTNPLGSALDEDYTYEISIFDGFPVIGVTTVSGKKYLKGKMEYYHGIVDRNDAMDQIEDVLNDVEEQRKGNNK